MANPAAKHAKQSGAPAHSALYIHVIHGDGTVETLKNGRGPRFLTRVRVHTHFLAHLGVAE